MSDDIHALSGAYAVDALDDVERARFERHLAGCDTCRAEVASLTAAAAEMAAATEVAPPATLRARVLDDISRVRPLPPLVGAEDAVDTDPGGTRADVPRHGGEPDGERGGEPGGAAGGDLDRRPAQRAPWRLLVAAAAALLLVVGGFAAWRAVNTDPTQVVAEQVLDAPDATRVAKRFPDGSMATIVRSDSLHRAVIVTSGMAPAPAGTVYQLWLQDPTGHMASAGVMPPGPDEVVVLEGDASKATGAGITIEPSGGSGQPTSDPIALFSFT